MNESIVPRILWEKRREMEQSLVVGWRDVSGKEVFLEEVKSKVS